MASLNKYILTLIIAVAATLTATAQRRVTPVEPTATQKGAQPTPDQGLGMIHGHDAEGRVVLIDTVTGMEFVDSTAFRIPKMIYPKLFRATFGLNIWDAAMRCTGQKYGIGSVWGEVNLHNRYFLRFEVGLGQASITPTAANFTYRSPLSTYFKLGAGYNVFYNSDPSYQFLVGLNYGFTPFRFSVDDVTVTDSYWDETGTFSIPSRSVTAGYLELTFGVKVKIVGPLSMGWTAIWHTLLHESRCPEGKPMYIPGFGKRGNSFTANFSLMYTFNLNKPLAPAVNK